MTNKKMILCAGLLLLSLSTAESANVKRIGDKIPDQVSVVKLKDIASNPAAYKDKEVVLKGNFGYLCCPTDFSYKEGLEELEISTKGFNAPKAKRGQPMRVYGVVRLGKLVPTEGEGKRENSAEEAKRDFSIEAKGLELL